MKSVAIFAIIVSIIFLYCFPSLGARAVDNYEKITIVLDAGHGGADGGVVGVKTGSLEKDLNLQIVKILQEYFQNAGFNVVLTRKTDGGLYDVLDSNFKKEDFERRRRIIDGANAAILISVHQNFYSQKTRRGSQVFFNSDNALSKELAASVQDDLNSGINAPKNGRKYSALKGDYYIIKCTEVPSVIVECGFLSNPIDDMLLSDGEFQKELAYFIMSGCVKYLTKNS